jgi:hypothetical protein
MIRDRVLTPRRQDAKKTNVFSIVVLTHLFFVSCRDREMRKESQPLATWRLGVLA